MSTITGDATDASGEYDRPEDSGKPISPKEVVRRYEEGAQDTRKQQAAYWQACAFVAGDQWLQVDSRNPDRMQRRVPQDEREILAVNNRLLPATVTIMAKLHRRPHVFECPPSSGDDAAVSGARLATAVVADTQRRQNWDATRATADLIAWKGATALLCVEWDADAGDSLAYDTTPGEGTTSPQVAGDVCVTALSTAEAFCEPGTKDIQRAFWWIKAVTMPPKTARRVYNLPKDPPADGKAHTKYDPSTWNRGDEADKTLVLTLFERPNRDCPEGRVVTVIDEEIVANKPWPFPWSDRLNVIPVTAVGDETRWIGQTVLWQAISLQYLLNRCESSLAEHLDALGRAKLAIQEGSLNADEEWDPSPYQPVYYNGTAGVDKPSYIEPPSMPTWVLQSPEHYKAAIDDIVNVHAVSRGAAPGGVESGVGLQYLGEQDDTPVGELARVSAAAWSQVACDVLEMYEANVAEEREVQVAQPKGPPQTMQWSGRMLAGQTVALIPPDSAAPRSRTSHLQLAMNLSDRGILGQPGTPEAQRNFVTFAEMPGSEQLLEAIDHQAAKARREVAKMFAGRVCIPRDFDNHATFIAIANEARLSERYDEADDEIKGLFDHYCLAHQKLAEEEMVRQKMRAIADPAMAVAAQAHQPALAGQPDVLVQQQETQDKVQHRGANAGGADAPFAPEMMPDSGANDMAVNPRPGEGN